MHQLHVTRVGNIGIIVVRYRLRYKSLVINQTTFESMMMKISGQILKVAEETLREIDITEPKSSSWLRNYLTTIFFTSSLQL